MDSLLVVNLENKKIPENIWKFLNRFYKVYKANTNKQAVEALNHMFIDLFLVIADDINETIAALLKEIRTERHDLLPAVVSLPEINAHNQSQAFQHRVLYLTEYPLNLDQLKKELSNVSRMTVVTSDKTISLSGRQYEKDYLVKNILYVERHRSREDYLNVFYREIDGEVSSDEFRFKPSMEKFIQRYGLTKHLIQINQSCLVNPRFVRIVDKRDKSQLKVVLISGEKLDLNATYYKRMKKGENGDVE